VSRGRAIRETQIYDGAAMTCPKFSNGVGRAYHLQAIEAKDAEIATLRSELDRAIRRDEKSRRDLASLTEEQERTPDWRMCPHCVHVDDGGGWGTPGSEAPQYVGAVLAPGAASELAALLAADCHKYAMTPEQFEELTEEPPPFNARVKASRFTIEQKFEEGFDPDRICTAFDETFRKP